MSTTEADRKIHEFTTERSKEIRKSGLRDASIGATVVCVCASFIYYEFKHPSNLFPSRQGKAMFFSYVAGLYGIWRLVNGLVWLVRPTSEKRSITELAE